MLNGFINVGKVNMNYISKITQVFLKNVRLVFKSQVVLRAVESNII